MIALVAASHMGSDEGTGRQGVSEHECVDLRHKGVGRSSAHVTCEEIRTSFWSRSLGLSSQVRSKPCKCALRSGEFEW
jgi:hypothetical protein